MNEHKFRDYIYWGVTAVLAIVICIAAALIFIRWQTVCLAVKKLNRILAENTGQPYEAVCRDTERDHYLTAEEAVSYGLVDKILVKH